MKQYIVDAFTNKPFSGNPAAVCVMDKWPSEEWKDSHKRRSNSRGYIRDSSESSRS